MIPPNATANPTRVMFLPDSGPEIGGGHVMRCLTLAAALGVRGAVCGFAARPSAGRVLDAFAGPGIERLPVDEGDLPALVRQAETAAASWGAQVVIADHYGLNAHHEARLRGGGRRLIALDDMPTRPHACDLLVDATLGRTADDYNGLLPPDARVLAGPEHALVRPEFATDRQRVLARREDAGPARKLLISLGLTDLRGVTGRIAHLIRPVLGVIEADIVAGAGAPSLTWLKRLEVDDARIRVHVETPEMAQLVGEADLAIGAGGSSTWERACLGLPTVVLILADNQRALALALERQGAALAVEAGGEAFGQRLTGAFVRLSGDVGLRASLSRVSAALCDGLGAQRVADAIMALVR